MFYSYQTNLNDFHFFLQMQEIVIQDIDGFEHVLQIQQHILQNKTIQELQQQLIHYLPLQKFVSSLDQELYDIKSIIINSIDYFGQRIGFLKLVVDAVNKINGKKIPGIVQLRGGSVAVLIEVFNVDTNETKYLLTQQIRMPTGNNLLEIPAGMLDGNGDITGVAIKEIKEETGIDISKEKLTFLGQAYSSPGLLDEMITYFQLKIKMQQSEINQIEKQIYGEENTNETIKIVFYSQNDVQKLVDGKFYTALGFKCIKGI